MRRTKPSRSAEVVAAERALLADRGVVDDPIAQTMLGPAVGLLYRVVRRWPGSIPTLTVTLAGLATRVLWHDGRVSEAMDAGIDQVVILGAGFDSRAWRMRRSGVRFFELDGPATQAQKVRRSPAGGPVFVAADLRTTSAASALARGGLDFGKPVVLVLEGVTMYLPEPDVRRVLGDLGSACADGSILTTDFHPPVSSGTSANRWQNRVQRLARVGSGEGLRSVVDQAGAVEIVESSGWRVAQVVGLRDAASSALPDDHHLPVGAVNNDKTLLSARTERASPRALAPRDRRRRTGASG